VTEKSKYREGKLIGEEKSLIILPYTEKQITPVRILKGIPRIKTDSKQNLGIVRTYETCLKIW
jgi:hypothetical protein